MSDISENQRIRNYYNVALKLVMKCGPVACAGYEETNIDFETKSAYYDFVTIYDKQVEDLLIAGLQTAFPETKVIGEESTAEDKSEPVLTDAPTLCKLTSNCSGYRGFGSAAVTLCYVARGCIDCFTVEDLQPWDIAGGALIVLEAGGVVYNFKGGEFSIMKPNCVVAATKELAKEVIGVINEADELRERQREAEKEKAE
ncbi:uncharacterized protein LOC105664664 [Ceratitis capitata]|uniref:uncharacterized protein LOC105664664 n=1 Tax=Ceratitis capitata TaxID=7213 RepID=UPI00061892C0|nr:uncharacterized protein LOC105664664 [Ceratitis capitata]